MAQRVMVRVHRALPDRDPGGRLTTWLYRIPRNALVDLDREQRRESALRDRLESLRSPDSIPALQDLRVDPAGNLWMELYQPPSPSARSTGISVLSPYAVLSGHPS